MVSLGIKHNNFWNVKKPSAKDSWNGAIGYDDKQHTIFDDPAFAVRAAIITLKAYQLKLKFNTLNLIFARYAPADDTLGSVAGAPQNQPNEYAAYVAKAAGLTPDTEFELFLPDGIIRKKDLLKKILKAMAKFECGASLEVPDEVLERGIQYYYIWLK